MVTLSAFGEKFSSGSGILSLMDDLGHALGQGDMIMMGGGNPGTIPLIEERMGQRLRRLTEDAKALRQLLGIYDPPKGNKEFCQALADLLKRTYGWEIHEENICLTNGSQAAFFLLFNLLAGVTSTGHKRKILLPMAPEYIGYADLGLVEDFFVSVRPRIEIIDDYFFKYRVDFDKIAITEEIGAICVSRPTNPTGNVLTDEEIMELARLAKEHDIPFIIDSAYGLPFPAMVYTGATPIWQEGIVLCMSLSKFGLPAVRTGILIADRRLVRLVSGANAIVNLETNTFGPMLTADIVRSGEIIELSREVIQPFYKQKMEQTLAWIHEYLAGIEYKIHVPEGAMFLWLWFPGLPVSARELYQRLKARGVIVVSGDYFFPGLPAPWQHTQECLRLTYSQDESDVQRGIALIAEELHALSV
ncbi:MAG: valine--pyruvate transaminase [Desulfobulbus sp.]|nr:valine--pyruvate transaminase [Desulfobulbus sp.]